MDITEVSILHHIGIVLVVLCILSSYGICHPFIYFLSFIYLYQVNGCYTLKLRKRLHFEERKQANQRRLLSDSETVRWLNHAVEKIWPICMEQIVSQKILLPIMPWFLDKYKPWTAAEAAVQSLYMGRNPPMFTEVRVLRQSADDDHLVLELGMNFLTADDMSSVLAVKLKKRLGFGIWTKMHITGMHIEGKVLVGVKFLRHWPFLGRLRVCFVEPPYFQMTVKPIFNHGLDVTELPGVAGWLDKLLAVAFEQTLVEPNMLVVDVEKFASEPTGTSESWFKMDEKCPIAFAKVEVIEAADLKPADLNGLADPYVKGQFGLYKFRTKTQKKTLTPQWQEEYKIPIHSWESLNTLLLEVNDQDHFVDDTLGDCSINISDFRGGKRHDKWLPLRNIKMGRLHLAVTVLEVGQEGVPLGNTELPNEKENANLSASEAAQQDFNPTVSSGKVTKLADEFEPINIEGQQQTGIWVLHPGSDVCQTWEPRKREGKRSEIEILKEGHNSLNSSGPLAAGSRHSDSSDELENPGGTRFSTIKKNLRKIGSIFHSHPRNENLDDREASPLPHINLHDVHEKKVGVKFVVDDENVDVVRDQKSEGGSVSSEKSEAGSPHKGHMKGMRKKMLNKAQSVKRALSKKEMHKAKGGLVPSAGTEVEVPLEFDSSEKGSPQSSKEYISIESIPIAPSTSSDDCKESPIANEENVQLGPLLTRDNMECVARKASFHGADGVDGDVECHEEPLVKVSSFRDAARIDDEAGRGKFLDTKLSNEGGGRTDGAVRDHTDEQVQTVEASFILQASEGT